VARSTRPALSVIVPEDGSTAATVPVASTDGVAGDVLLVPEPDDDGGVAAPATWMLFTSPLTPLTAPAIWAARARFSLESTVPLSVTMPLSVLTSILRKFEGDSAASSS
jgi:hypothetical protein